MILGMGSRRQWAESGYKSSTETISVVKGTLIFIYTIRITNRRKHRIADMLG